MVLVSRREESSSRYCFSIQKSTSHFLTNVQEKEVIIQSTAADKIAQLQSTKEKLARQRKDLQNKIDKLTAKSTPDATNTNVSDG